MSDDTIQPSNLEILEILKEAHRQVFVNRWLKLVNSLRQECGIVHINSSQWGFSIIIEAIDFTFPLEMPDWFWKDTPKARMYIKAKVLEYRSQSKAAG